MNTADILNAYLNGQRLFRSFNKFPSQATGAGIWFDLSLSSGNPQAQFYFATPQVALALARSTDGGLDHGDAKSGYNKYLHKLDIQTVGAVVPMQLELLDYLLYYPGIAMDPGEYDMVNNVPLPRYSGYEALNVQIMVIEQNSYGGGATFTINYTNSQGVSNRNTPTITCNSQTVTGTIATSALATAGSCGRFVALQQGDTGVQSVQNLTIINPDTGLLCVVLVKSLATFSIQENVVPSQFNLLDDFSILPKIKDDAYLNFICQPQASLAGVQIIGNIHTFWSNA